jgi:hypothetical protein
MDQGGYLASMRSLVFDMSADQLVLTFDGLLRRTPLPRLMRRMLRLLETHYHSPVDTEFTVRIGNPSALQPEVEICILQCRPQSHLKESDVSLPVNLQPEDIIFSTPRMAPEGRVENIHYVIFISPEAYYRLPTASARSELGRAIGRLNAALAEERFICVGPGRWGTSNPDLGLHIGYGDIYHTRALVELAGAGIGPAPEASFGTHFFQDLVESNIYPLAIYLLDDGVIFSRAFFYETPNHLKDFLPEEGSLSEVLRLIEVASYRSGRHLELVMDDEAGRAVAFLQEDEE